MTMPYTLKRRQDPPAGASRQRASTNGEPTETTSIERPTMHHDTNALRQ